MERLMYEPALEPEETERPRCPICGEELNGEDKVYLDEQGVCIGCSSCIRSVYADSYFD